MQSHIDIKKACNSIAKKKKVADGKAPPRKQGT
jgi:hypothetical protein